MEVSFKIEKWSIRKDEKTHLPIITGQYSLEAMGKTVAKQSFNNEYGSDVQFPFSMSLTQKIQDIEKEIIEEIHKLVK
jgi:hypothetical protein